MNAKRVIPVMLIKLAGNKQDRAKERKKMKYIKSTQMGVSTTLTAQQAKEEIDLLIENALPTDVMEYRVVEMSEEEFEKLPEFQGY